MSAGKGSAPRPFDIPREVYESNHDRIFGKRERKQYVPPPAATPEQVVSARGHRTQEAVAKLLEVSVNTIQNWEHGRAPVPMLAYKELLATRGVPSGMENAFRDALTTGRGAYIRHADGSTESVDIYKEPPCPTA